MAYNQTIFDLPLADAKARFIRDQKLELHLMLSLTDWLIIRREDTGDNIPQAVLDYRSALRQQEVSNEAIINSSANSEQLKSLVGAMTRIYQVSIDAGVIDYLTNYPAVYRIIQEM